MAWYGLGYHGTDCMAADSILGSQQFKFSNREDDWLGQGVYFYYADGDARWWCLDVKKWNRYVILQAKLEATTVVDLAHSPEDGELFRRFCETVKNKSEKMGNGSKRRNYMSLAIKIMARITKPDIIIGAFDENRRFWFTREELRKKFPLILSQLQICVCNHSCIKDISVLEEVRQ